MISFSLFSLLSIRFSFKIVFTLFLRSCAHNGQNGHLSKCVSGAPLDPCHQQQITNLTSHNDRNSRAVLTVMGAFFSLFCTVGLLNAFGVFQQYYKEAILQDMTESDISWIGSVGIFLLYRFAPITGVLVDRFGPRVGFLMAEFTVFLELS